MLNVVNYFRGHVEVEISGPFPERFLNVCALGGIEFWGLQRLDGTRLRARMRPSGYKKAAPYADKTMCRIKLARRRGVPFALWRIRQRWALILGFLLTLGSLYGLSLFVWEFEVTGNELISSETILRHLAEIGVKPGIYGPSIDIATIKNEMLLRVEGLSWLTVNRNGSHATVEVRERIPKPEIFPADQPCDIIAAKDGLILRVDAKAGDAKVKSGETVTRGQLIVGGEMDYGEMGTGLVHASADVYARTWYDLQAVMPLQYTGKQYTGQEKTRRFLVVAGQRVNISFLDFSSYEYCDKLVKTTTLQLPFNVTLPITLVTETYVEYIPVDYTLPREQAAQMLKTALSRRLDELLGEGEVISAELQAEVQGGVLRETLAAECMEQIGVAAPLER
jgi:similar to stage IV sporulation protein